MSSAHRWISGALAALTLGALLTLATRFEVTTELTVFTPSVQSDKSRILISQLDRGVTTGLVFVALAGAAPESLAAASQALTELLAASGHFRSIRNGRFGLSETELRLLSDYRYLLSPDDDDGANGERKFSEPRLRQALQERLQGLMSPLGALEKQFFRNDPGGETLALMQRLRSQGPAGIGPRLLHGVWFSRDKSRTLLLLDMQAGSLDPDGQRAALEALERAFAEVRERHPGLAMTSTGPGAFAEETRRNITAEVRLLSLLAITGTGLFLFLALGSLRMLGLVLVPLTLGIITATAAVLWAFGSIHGITLTFGITLIGVAVDYPLHWFSYLAGRPAGASRELRIWPTLRLGVLSTVIAYLVFLLSDFSGLRQLGLFTVAGLLTAAASTRYLLPLLAPATFTRGRRLDGAHRALTWLAQRAPLARWPVVALLAAAGVFLAVTDKPLRNFDVDSLSPISSERRAEDLLLRADLGFWSGGRMLAITAADAEGALRRSEALRAALEQLREEQVISHYLMAASYLPSVRTQERRRGQLPGAAALGARIETVARDFPFKTGAFAPFIKDVAKSRELQPLTPATLAGTSLGRRLQPLLFQSGEQWVATILLYNARDEEALARFAEQHAADGVVYLNLKRESSRIIGGAIDHTTRLLLWGAFVIYLLLVLNLRSLRTPLRILLPTFGAALGVTALLVASGSALTLFHMVSLLLVIGLGLDYTLFFNRLNDHDDEWDCTFRALWICCVTTLLVFGILLLSHTPPLRAIGITVALGAPLCLALGAVLSVGARSPLSSAGD